MKDRIKLAVGDVVFKLKPLSVYEMQAISASKKNESGTVEKQIMSEAFQYLKHAVVGLEGVTGYDDKPYELEFVDGQLSDDCASELFSMNLGSDFLFAIQKLKLNELSMTYITDGSPLKGVKLEVIPHQDQNG